MHAATFRRGASTRTAGASLRRSAAERRLARDTRRSVVGLGAVALVITTVVLVSRPAGVYEEVPGPVLALADRLTVGDASLPDSAQPPLTPIDGAYDGLTVVLRPLSVGQVAWRHLTGDNGGLVREAQIKPPQLTDAEYHAFEKTQYVDGAQVAAAVAERALGLSVSVDTDGLRVLSVAPGSAAERVLAVDDTLVAAGGTALDDPTQLRAAVAAAAGRALELSVRHADGSTATVTITARPLASGGTPVLGVVATADRPVVHLAYPVGDDASGVEGPSAGLMTALTVYDELSPTDVARGRTIAGTGTMSLDGSVGEIGGIAAKAQAALEAGAQLFLAPASQADDARAVLGDRVPVVGVRSFDQALVALHAHATRDLR
ncbi:MAG: S16 family serine protease [Acidimicrobiales bacterium]